MKIILLILGFALASSPSSMSQEESGRVDPVHVLEIGDRRDVEALVELAGKGSVDAIIALGHAGDPEACKALTDSLSSDVVQVRAAAARAVGYCGNTALAQWLRYRLRKEDDVSVRGELAYALGLLGLETDRDLLVTLVNNGGDDRTIAGLLQSIAYASLKASDLGGLDFDKLLEGIAGAGVGESYAAYLLARLGGLFRVVDYAKLEAAMRATGSDHARIMLAPTLGSYGDIALPLLSEYATSPSANLRAAVAPAFIKSEGAEARAILGQLAVDEAARVRRIIAQELAALEVVNDVSRALVHHMANDESPWVRAAIAGALYRHDRPAGIELARAMLAGDNLYLKATAVRLLGDDEVSKAAIQAMADNDKEPWLQGAARTALGIELEASNNGSQPTPDVEDALASLQKHLVLETTRGRITIALSRGAPFAAWNFVQLAEFGYLDDVMWHRVIPNFVAQAGARNDEEGKNWGTIREEWGGTHKPYSVGVATSGRDTGSRQFFINTRHNLHLDNRYTVFGHVIEGFEVVDALEEGDMILTADTVYPD